jgi:hypothetical protein
MLCLLRCLIGLMLIIGEFSLLQSSLLIRYTIVGNRCFIITITITTATAIGNGGGGIRFGAPAENELDHEQSSAFLAKKDLATASKQASKQASITKARATMPMQ